MNICENIYNERLKFWDKEVLQEKSDFIDKMLELFIVCQNIRSKKEESELRRCFSNLAKWMDKSMEWKETSYDDYVQLYERHLEIISNFEANNEEIKSAERSIDISTDNRTYCFKFVIIHI